MMIPRIILRNMKQRISVVSEDELQSMLDRQNKILERLKFQCSKETFEYESFSTKQKIQLIENELKSREKNTQTMI